MLKYLLLALIVLWLFYSPAIRGRLIKPRHTGKPKAPPTTVPPQEMVRCAHCGLHLPAAEALVHAGQPYCSAAHREAGPGRT